MPRCLVKGPNDKYAIWSSVVDDFVFVNATLQEAVAFEVADPIHHSYPGGAVGLERDIRRGAMNIEENGRAWRWAPTLDEAVEIVVAVHGEDAESLRILAECEWL